MQRRAHTIDLSRPAAPRVAGELKIPGYSAHLHPVGDGLLLGVGQDVTADGRLRGTQVSLFDISDPSKPARLHQRTFGGGGQRGRVGSPRVSVVAGHDAGHWPSESIPLDPHVRGGGPCRPCGGR